MQIQDCCGIIVNHKILLWLEREISACHCLIAVCHIVTAQLVSDSTILGTAYGLDLFCLCHRDKHLNLGIVNKNGRENADFIILYCHWFDTIITSLDDLAI